MSAENDEKVGECSNPLSDRFDPFGNPLFEMKGSKNHWYFVRLVAKKGSDMQKITTKDAFKAFCLLCRKHITYTPGNGNSVYRHVEKNHKRELEDLDHKREEMGPLSLHGESKTEPKKKRLKPTSVPEFFPTTTKLEKNLKQARKACLLHGQALITVPRAFRLVRGDYTMDVPAPLKNRSNHTMKDVMSTAQLDKSSGVFAFSAEEAEALQAGTKTILIQIGGTDIQFSKVIFSAMSVEEVLSMTDENPVTLSFSMKKAVTGGQFIELF
jgi:hypothetical protein